MSNQTDDQVHEVPTHENASDAVRDGQESAAANARAEREASTNEGASREEIVEDAQNTAEENARVDRANQPDRLQEDGFKNDTSKKAKVDTTKAQLDPTGTDPISKAEITRAATNGSEAGKVGTGVTNEEAANRARDEDTTGQEEDAAGNPTLGNGETNPEADGDALHPGGGDADGSANASTTATTEPTEPAKTDSADKK